jgi:RNA polymerase sigma-70 factor (ECF subfamily)
MTHNACKDYLDSQQRAVAASGDTRIRALLESVESRDDRASRIEAAFDLEQLETAQARVRERVEPHTWEALRMTALEGQTGAEVAARLGMQVGTVFEAKSNVDQMLRQEIERMENQEPKWLAALAGPPPPLGRPPTARGHCHPSPGPMPS